MTQITLNLHNMKDDLPKDGQLCLFKARGEGALDFGYWDIAVYRFKMYQGEMSANLVLSWIALDDLDSAMKV